MSGHHRVPGRRLIGVVALALAMLGGLAAPAQGAVFEQRNFPNEIMKVRYKALIDELRCLVCQNQNIADSDAELAQDLRNKVFELLMAGRSDTEILDFMVARYGDFVLYRPPVKALTVGLWAGPLILLVGGIWLLVAQIRKQGKRAPVSEERRQLAERLLTGDGQAPVDRS